MSRKIESEFQPSTRIARAILCSPVLRTARRDSRRSRRAQDAFLSFAARAEGRGLRGYVRTVADNGRSSRRIRLFGTSRDDPALNDIEIKNRLDRTTQFLEAYFELNADGSYSFEGEVVELDISTRGNGSGVVAGNFRRPHTKDIVKATEVAAVFDGDKRMSTEDRKLVLHLGQDPRAVTSMIRLVKCSDAVACVASGIQTARELFRDSPDRTKELVAMSLCRAMERLTA